MTLCYDHKRNTKEADVSRARKFKILKLWKVVMVKDEQKLPSHYILKWQ
jgi:hypothetical protein